MVSLAFHSFVGDIFSDPKKGFRAFIAIDGFVAKDGLWMEVPQYLRAS